MYKSSAVVIVGLIFGVCFVHVDCEIFSAIEKLEQLFRSERIFIRELEKFAKNVDDDYIHRKLKAWKLEHNSINETDIWRYITNPLNAFLMIKRSTADIGLIENRFGKRSDEFLHNIRRLQPEALDLTGAVDGLLRLQFFYKLKTVDIANGIIDGVPTRSPLSIHDLFVIGEEALKVETDDLALEYLSMVWKQLKQGLDIDNEINEEELLLVLIHTYTRVSSNREALEMIKELKRKYPQTATMFSVTEKMLINELKKSNGSSQNVLDPFANNFLRDGKYTDSKDRILNSQVCRGDEPKSTSKLYCRYASTNAFSQLARFKIEEANLEPYILLFIDVVSNDEIKFLKAASKRKQGPGTIRESSLLSTHRIAQVAWHYKYEHKFFRTLSRRIEDMTGLSQKTAEPLQTQNYGIGGHYSSHWDFYEKSEKPVKENGNRIATVLFYLSDVEKGGGTVFPFLNLRVLPRKGAAVFWHNLSPCGAYDFLTRHSACPVLLGSKWVANAWIREHGNEFRRPCFRDEMYDDKRREQMLYEQFY